MIESDQLYGRLRRNPALANNSIAGYRATSDRRWEQGGVGRRIELVGEPADYRRAGRGSSYNTVGQAGLAPRPNQQGSLVWACRTMGPAFHQWSAAACPKCFVEGVES
jgi:hypothetical protein